jgi:DNA invertase Pin-like site-specific DNA recombinase
MANKKMHMNEIKTLAGYFSQIDISNKIKKNDVVEEIENIMEEVELNGQKNYLIKWVGSKTPTWITLTDFIECDELKSFLKYKKKRENKSLKRRAYIYCRTSRRNAEREVSLHDQEQYCLDYAKKNKINIIGIYRDNGVSAKNIDNQYSLNYLCDKIKEKECILVYDVSRFSRSITQAIQVLENLRNNAGAIVHACHDGLTWNDTATSRACFRINLSNAQLHSEVISEKVKSAIEFRRTRGDHIGYVPYGYSSCMVNGVRQLIENNKERKIINAVLSYANKIYTDKKKNGDLDDVKKMLMTIDINKKIKRDKKSPMILKPQDYRSITAVINKRNKNRRNKPFTWASIRKIHREWNDKTV